MDILTTICVFILLVGFVFYFTRWIYVQSMKILHNLGGQNTKEESEELAEDYKKKK